jgi:hypothetical protein
MGPSYDPRCAHSRRDWSAIGPALPAVDEDLQGFCEYRYRDSNPGFRRERATEHPTASGKIRHYRGFRVTSRMLRDASRQPDVRLTYVASGLEGSRGGGARIRTGDRDGPHHYPVCGGSPAPLRSSE